MTALADSIANVLAAGLTALHALWGSYLAAIVLLTIGVKLVLHPLTRKQLKSMKAMQALAPQMEVLRRKYKDDPRQLNVEIMSLYRANKVNPFGGCLPMLLQLPILWGLFRLLSRPNIFGNEALFGVPLEAHPTFQAVAQHPLIALVPLLVGLTTYLQQNMSITDPTQAKMFIFMPIMITWFSINFPVGMSIYWIVSTAAYIAEYYLVVGAPRRVGVAPPREARGARRARRRASAPGHKEPE
ncbi:MAG: YidC/Oxa1 family membrane protein insertase [Armatimonadota bacterium]|nr:YidC/Oxa1 family membrane protein insertase [Armatimonadota bacterium]